VRPTTKMATMPISPNTAKIALWSIWMTT